MKTKRRLVLKKLFASIAGLTALGLAGNPKTNSCAGWASSGR
jgi:hypothetical protein